MRILRFLLPAVMALVQARACSGQLAFTLQPLAQTGTAGSTLDFSGILTNNGALDISLNGDGFSGLGPGLTLDDSPFFNNAPALLTPGQAWSGGIFDVAIDPSTQPGLFFGSFTVVGGADANAQDNLATQNFQITVQTTPEPGSLALLAGLGITRLFTMRHRRRRTSFVCDA